MVQLDSEVIVWIPRVYCRFCGTGLEFMSLCGTPGNLILNLTWGLGARRRPRQHQNLRLRRSSLSRLYLQVFRRILLSLVGRWGDCLVCYLRDLVIVRSLAQGRPKVCVCWPAESRTLTLCDSLAFRWHTAAQCPVPTAGWGCVKDLTQASLGSLWLILRSANNIGREQLI